MTILWDFRLITDRIIHVNRPDIFVKNYGNKTCLMIDMVVPAGRNISAKEFEKMSRYKDLQIKIGRMWHLKQQ